MSENTLEDIKKICLICGCHTKQAINIYEPRNGPNIIELIQAKFKFQPVNDDKYLCYSCNNWLINWHSLQTLNNSSNNESGNYGHSSKSRSHYIRNESIPEEECNDHNVIKIRNGYHNFYNYEKNNDHKRDNDKDNAVNDVDDDNDYKKKDNNGRNLLNNISKQKRMGFYFPRRNCIKWRRIRKVRRKYKQYRSCSFCGRSLKTHLPIRYRGLNKKITIKCKTCSRILEWSSNYTKSLLNEENRKLKEFNIINNINNHHIHNNYNNKNNENDNNNCNINNTIINNNKNNKNLLNNYNNHKIIKNFNTNINNESLVINNNNNRYHYSHHHHPYHQRPLIDGKVVAMLRRLGTTLTRESDCTDNIDIKLQNNMTAAAAKNNYLIRNNNEYQQQQQQLLQLQHQQYQKNLSFSHNNICLNYNNNNNNNNNNNISNDNKNMIINNNNCNLNKREMEDNEILIDFNTAITEVLQPFDLVKYQITSSTLSSLNIMKLTNKNPDVEIIDVENDKNTGQDQQEQEQQQQQQQQPQLSLEAIYKRIPKCVTISVISSSSSDSGGSSDGGIIVGSNNNVDGIIGSGNNNHHKNSSSAIVEN